MLPGRKGRARGEGREDSVGNGTTRVGLRGPSLWLVTPREKLSLLQKRRGETTKIFSVAERKEEPTRGRNSAETGKEKGQKRNSKKETLTHYHLRLSHVRHVSRELYRAHAKKVDAWILCMTLFFFFFFFFFCLFVSCHATLGTRMRLNSE